MCVGDDAQVQGEAAPRLFGVLRRAGTWEAAPGTQHVELLSGAPCFVTARSGYGLVVWCPIAGKNLSGLAAQRLVNEVQERLHVPLLLPRGLTGTAFVSQGRLLLALCDQGDLDRSCPVSVRPTTWLAPGNGYWCAVDLDSGMRCPGVWEGATGTLSFQVAMPASGGRMVMITGGGP